jgi:hypothetical protein
VPEMDVDTRRVDAVLDAERTVFSHRSLELFEELGFRNDLVDSAFQDGELMGDVPHGSVKTPRRLPSLGFQAARPLTGPEDSAICRF